MIVIQNRQRSVKIDTAVLKEDAQRLLDALKYPDFDLSIVLVNSKTIHQLNRDYRAKDKPTDILSFAFYPHLKAGQRIKALDEEDKNLGDLVICPSYIVDKLPKLETTFEKRLKVLLVHGLCHLLGYDHETDAEYKVMQRLENRLLKILNP